MMETIERLESRVRTYVRNFPVVFERARGSHLTDAGGRDYLDFFTGAGALSYGHNDPPLKDRVIEYLREDGVVHSLDMATTAKIGFLEALDRLVLRPRELVYRVMFCGPTGTNAVESALKLARKLTGRTSVVAFTNGFHGMTLGSLALTGNREKRAGAAVPLAHVTRMPFDGYFGPDVDTLAQIETLLTDPSGGFDPPAAFVVETIQAEGGVNVATDAWLRGLADLARRLEAVLIVDDIQVGCGRTGPFFSFEPAGLRPDMICLSKALSGLGLPLAVTLVRPELDVWEPGEHNGTFRGHNLAFVAARAALEHYWADDELSRAVARRAQALVSRLEPLAGRLGGRLRGRGLIQGLAFEKPEFAGRVCREAFRRGLILETCGPRDHVVKMLPPLNISDTDLDQGLARIEASIEAAGSAGGEGPVEAPR